MNRLKFLIKMALVSVLSVVVGIFTVKELFWMGIGQCALCALFFGWIIFCETLKHIKNIIAVWKGKGD